jgi:hypothetical protein
MTALALPENDIEQLSHEIHTLRQQRDALWAERDADPLVEQAAHALAQARRAAEQAEAAFTEACAKYAERARLLEEREEQLKARIRAAWPSADVKTIGLAQMSTTRAAALKPGLAPCDAFRKLAEILPPATLPKIVTGITLDKKTALGALDVIPTLGEVLRVEESHTLRILKPKEE